MISIFILINRSNPNSKVLHALAYIGTMTLEIYLIHYFIIELMKNGMNCSLYAFSRGSVIEFPVFIMTSICIVVLCLLIVLFLKRLGLYRFIFPSSNKLSPLIKGLS